VTYVFEPDLRVSAITTEKMDSVAVGLSQTLDAEESFTEGVSLVDVCLPDSHDLGNLSS